jgi:hypothetical protein
LSMRVLRAPRRRSTSARPTTGSASARITGIC